MLKKIKIEFEGWHCLSKKIKKTILDLARAQFINANFIDNSGLLIESPNELEIFRFCLEVIQTYKSFLGSWDGYTVRKISKRIVYNYQDKKRKLSFEFFQKLIKENRYEDIKVVIAGNLYLDPSEASLILNSIERDLKISFEKMDEKKLKMAYNLLIKLASISVRKFSLENQNSDEKGED